jgi:hypothetical protein
MSMAAKAKKSSNVVQFAKHSTKSKEGLFQVTVNIKRREFEKGKTRTHDFEGQTSIDCEIPTKYNLFVQCMRQFGRCCGLIPMGWRFERLETFADGSKRWVEYHVRMQGDVEPNYGFHLVRKRP